VLPTGWLGSPLLSGTCLCVGLICVVNFLPNTQDFMRLFRPVISTGPIISDNLLGLRCAWKPSLASVCFICILGVAAFSQLDRVQAFIYFRF
jgi:hypothetical protein